jgi:hypothetical protein
MPGFTNISNAVVPPSDNTNSGAQDFGSNSYQAAFYLPAGKYNFNIQGIARNHSGNIDLKYANTWHNFNSGLYTNESNGQTLNYINIFRSSQSISGYYEINYNIIRTVKAGWWSLGSQWNNGNPTGKFTMIITQLS